MIRIDATTFYQHGELRAMFKKDGLDWEWLRQVTKPRRVIGKAYWGGDIIKAIESAPESRERRHGRDDASEARIEEIAPAPKRKGRTLLDQVMKERVAR